MPRICKPFSSASATRHMAFYHGRDSDDALHDSSRDDPCCNTERKRSQSFFSDLRVERHAVFRRGGGFFSFTGLLLYLPLPVKNEARLTILCTDALLWIINPALSIALLPAGAGRNGKFCVNLYSPPILGMNRSLYRMLLENETSRAVRESGHIAHNADGVSLSRLTAAYLPSCRSASGHV